MTTSNDPLPPGLNAFVTELSARLSEMPDYSKMVEPLALQMARTLGSYTAAVYPADRFMLETSGAYQMVKTLQDSMAAMNPTITADGTLALATQMQSTIGAATKFLADSVDTSGISSILANAATFRDRLAEEEYEELADDFFENHPDLAQSLEQSPSLYALSKSDRRLVVWFVGIFVTLFVGNALLHVGTDMPELKAIIDAFGLDAGGGVPAGLTAAAASNEVLKKLPQEESE